jgi:hypothetical protein
MSINAVECGKKRFKDGAGLGMVGCLAVSIAACDPAAVALSPTLATPCLLNGTRIAAPYGAY